MRSRLNSFMPSHYSANNDLESSSILDTVTRMPYLPAFPAINYASSSSMEHEFTSSSSSRNLIENTDILNLNEEDDIDFSSTQSAEVLSIPETDVAIQENTSRESCNIFDTSKISTLGKRNFDETSSTSSEDVSDEEIIEALGFLASPNYDDSSSETGNESSISSLFLSPNSATESINDSISSPLVLKLKISNNKRKADIKSQNSEATEEVNTPNTKKIKVDSSLKKNIDDSNIDISPATQDASLVLKLRVSNNKRKSDANEEIDTTSKKIKLDSSLKENIDNLEDDDNSLMFSPDSFSSPVFVNLKTPNTAETFTHSPIDTGIFSPEPEQESFPSSSSSAMCPLDEIDLSFLGDDYDDIENFGL